MQYISGKKKWFWLFGGLVLAYALFGFFGVPYLITQKVIPDLSKTLNRPVLVREVALNPFAFTLQIQGFEIRERDQSPLLGFEELFLNFELSSLLHRSYTFEEIRLNIPFGLIRILSDGALNVAALSPQHNQGHNTPAPPEPESKEPLPPIDIASFSIKQGALEFRDESLPTPFTADIVPIQFTLKNFSTREKDNAHSLHAEFGEGEVLSWEGTLSLDPFQSEGEVSLSNLGLHTIWEYIRDQVRFEIPRGVGSVSARYRVEALEQGTDIKISQGKVLIRDLVLKDKHAPDPVITLPRFEVEHVGVDVLNRQVMIDSVQSQDAQFTGWLNEDGTVNFQTLFQPVGSSRSNDPAEPDPRSHESSEPWNVTVKTIGVQNYSANFEDRTLASPVAMDVSAFDITLSDVTIPPQKPVSFSSSLTLNSSGTVQSKGSLVLDPLSAEADVNISKVELKPFEPYVQPFAHIDIAGGAFHLQGRLQYHGKQEGQPFLQYAGTLGLNGLRLRESDSNEDILGWGALALNGIALDVEPTAMHIDEVVLEKPQGNLAIQTDGTTNIAHIFPQAGSSHTQQDTASGTEPEPSPEQSEESVRITIDAVRFVDGAAHFVDRSIVPNVVTSLHNFSGVIKGLSSREKTKAALVLKGKIDKFAPFAIKGNINPLTRDLYTKLAISLKGMNLGSASPYSGKYVGYPIQKGKLSLDLHYSIADQHLVGENKIRIDQFTFGKKTNSPDATGLPVPLAVALMKDRRGLIDIDLPVRGDLNSPEFSYGGLILQALVNLITKVATSPFAALGNLVGGSGEELQYVEFQPGSTNLLESEVQKLTSLAKALEERPGLRLEISGSVDESRDGSVLAETKLVAQLQRLKEKEPPSTEAPPLPGGEENSTGSTGNDATLLRKLYVKTFGKEPLKGSTGITTVPSAGTSETGPSSKGDKTIPETPPSSSSDPEKREPLSPEEIKKALLENIDIPKSELLELAKDRATAIQEFLIQKGKIQEERMFQSDIHLERPSETDGADLVRVPLSLAP